MQKKFPSAHRLSQDLNVSLDIAESIRKFMRLAFQLEDCPELTKAWVRHCYHMPSKIELAMDAIDRLIGGFGVEAIWPREWDSAMQPLAIYVNTGDTYHSTVLYSYALERFFLTTWGDFIEQHPEA